MSLFVGALIVVAIVALAVYASAVFQPEGGARPMRCRDDENEGRRDHDSYHRPSYERSRSDGDDRCYFRGYDEAEREDERRREQRAAEEAEEERRHARRIQERRDEEAYDEELAYQQALESEK